VHSVDVNEGTSILCFSEEKVEWFFTKADNNLKSNRSLEIIPISYQNPLEIYIAETLQDGYYYCYSQSKERYFLSYTLLKVFGKKLQAIFQN